MENHKLLLPRATLESIEVEGSFGYRKRRIRSQYSVRLYVGDNTVAKSACSPTSSVLKWEWNVDNVIWFEPSSMMKVVIHRGLDVDIKPFNHFVGKYEGKIVDLLENDSQMTLKDKKGDDISAQMKVSLAPIADSEDYIKEFMERVDTDVSRLPSRDAVLGAVSTLGQVLKITKSIIDKFTQAHPILGASWSIIAFLYQAVQETNIQDQSIRELSSTLSELLAVADTVPYLPVIPNTANVLEEIGRQSLTVASLIHAYASPGFAGRTLKLQISDTLKSRILDCQQHCVKLKESFHTRLHLDTNTKVDRISRTVDLINDDVLAKKITDWLSPPDNSRNRDEAQRKRQEDTCSWFLTGQRFTRWLEEPGFMWVKGKSGCGKTILCSSIIDDLPQPSPTVGVTHFFFDGRDGQTELQLHNKLLRSLTSQLSDSRHGGIPPVLADLHRQCGSQQPLTRQLQKVLHDVLESFARVYIVIDALDECSNRKDTVSWINELVSDTPRKVKNLHILVTSRPERDIEDAFEVLDPLSTDVAETSANADIAEYIEHEIATNFGKFDDATREVIESGLWERAEGSFRWVALQLEQLENCPSDYAVMEQMKNLPKDLGEIYARILKEIDGPYRDDTVTLLEWLCFAQRPMKVLELAETVTVDFKAEEEPVFNTKKRYKNPRDILLRCSSLITESDGYLKLSHFSVKEYLLSNNIERCFHINESASHTKISEISVSYLLQFNLFDHLPYPLPPLAKYAAEFWIDHVKSASMDPILDRLILRLFTSEWTAFRNWVQIWDLDDPYRSQKNNKDKTCSPLYYALLAGLLDISKQLLENGADANCSGRSYGSALQAASARGYGDIVKLLLEKGADVNYHGGMYYSALKVASIHDHVDIVKILLDNGADVNLQGEYEGNALQEATVRGYTDIVKLLLEKGADVNLQGGHQDSALQEATVRGYTDIVKLLLEKGADVNLQGGHQGSALQEATVRGYTDIVKLLLEQDADVNYQEVMYYSALQVASTHGYVDIVKMLLKKGADVNLQGGYQGSALQEASYSGHGDIVKMLLENGADANLQGNGKYQGSALQAASFSGHGDIVKLLLEKGVDVNLQGGYHNSALQAVSSSGHKDIVKLLLENGADVNLQGGYRGSALQEASYSGHGDIVRMLLESGADFNFQGGYEGNALLVATSRGHKDIVKLLLDKGADFNYQGGTNYSVLQVASTHGYVDIVKMLLEKGADVNLQVEYDGSALQAASSRGHGDVVKLLLENGADINLQGGEDGNAIQAASVSGHEDVVKLLLEQGADINAEGGYYGSALQGASSQGYGEIVKLLLEKGAHANLQGGRYGSALQVASFRSNVEVVRILLEHGADASSVDLKQLHHGRICEMLLAAQISIILPSSQDTPRFGDL